MSTSQYMRDLINLVTEARLPTDEVSYETNAKEVIAVLKSYKSQSYTKLGQKLEKIDLLEKEIKKLKDETKAEAKEAIIDLFDAEDAVHTRVVDTLSFIFTLSKDPKRSESIQYENVLEALSEHLTPELIEMLEKLKKEMVTIGAQKSPSLRATRKQVSEAITDVIGSWYKQLKKWVLNWGAKYDQKLEALKNIAGI